MAACDAHESGPLTIRRATHADADAVCMLYDRMHAAAEGGVNYNAPTWRHGQYPGRDTAEGAAENATLHIGLRGDTLCAAVILNQTQVDGYERAPWRLNASPEDVLVINTLVVDPACCGMGYGAQMIAHAKAVCRSMGCKTMRLSTYSVNLPAIGLYQKCGFAYLCDLVHPDGAQGLSYAMLDWLA